MLKQIENFTLSLKGRNLSAHTLRAYQSDLQEFAAFMSLRNLLKVKDFKIQNIRAYLAYENAKEISRNTMLRKISALRSFAKFLTNRGYIEASPFKFLAAPKREKLLPKFLSEEEAVKLVTSPQGGRFEQRNKAILELMYSSGLRRSEITGLNLCDVNFNDGIVKVLGKGSKERLVPVTDAALDALQKYIITRPQETAGKSAPLFLSSRGTRLSGEALRLLVEGAALKTNLARKITPHSLRHTFATHLLNNGCDLKSLQEMLGHKSLSATQVYTHVSLDRIKKVYNSAHPKAGKN